MNSIPKNLRILKEWVNSTLLDDKKLLEIPLTSSSKKSPFLHKYISEATGISLQTLGRYAEHLSPLVQALENNNWLQPDIPLLEQDIIRRHRRLLIDMKSNMDLLKTNNLVVRNNLNIKLINELANGGTRVTKEYSHAYKYFKEEFEPQVFELLKNNDIYDNSQYKTLTEIRKESKYRRGLGDAAKDIKKFVKSFLKKADKQALLRVEFGQTQGKDDCIIRHRWVVNQINQSNQSQWGDISEIAIKNNVDALSALEQELKAQNIWVTDIRGLTLNLINKLKLVLHEFEQNPSLLSNPKIRVGNKVSKRALKRLFPDIIDFDLTSAFQTHSKLKKHWKETFQPTVLSYMKKHGVFDSSSYKTVKERVQSIDYERIKITQERSDRFDEYRDSNSSTYAEIISNSLSDELLHIAAITSRETDTISQYKCTQTLLINYYEELGISDNTNLEEIFGEYSACQFRTWLEDKIAGKSISANTAHGYIHSFQRILDSYYDLEDVDKSKPFIKVSGFTGATRSTDRYKPYVKEHRTIIASVVEEAIDKVRSLHFKEYKKAVSGKSFIGVPKLGKQVKSVVADDCTLENLKWYFDNVIDSVPVYRHHYNELPKDDPRSLFWKAWMNYRRVNNDAYSEITDLYDEWDVSRPPSLLEIIPYYLKLLQVTGLNAESACKLSINSFVEAHPATGRPCIRYFKERSDGEKTMLLDLFTAELNWLSTSQCKEVSKIFSDLKKLTASIRVKTDNYSDHLFIYQNNPGVVTNTIQSLDGSERGRVSKRANKSLGLLDGNWDNTLVDENGEIISITTTRFRPSLVSELVEAGVSIREIQLILGHSSIQTTLKYLDTCDFNKVAREKIEEKLKQIYSNALVEKEHPTIGEVEKAEGEIIFKTPLGGCRNIMNNPDFIKQSSLYKGGACNKYNQCLLCENVIITTSHLPQLFALQRDYIQSLSHQRIASTPYGHVIQENLAILETILGSESEFSQEELKKAQKLSTHIESSILIDGVTA